MLFIEYPKCSTCQKAKKWLIERGIAFEERDIVTDHPSAQEIATWSKTSGLPLKKFFNTSGLKYKALNLKDKLPLMSFAEQTELLGTDGMLVKRPIVVDGERVITGFREKEWEAFFDGKTVL